MRKEIGLYVSDGEEYGENGKQFIRINVACPYQRMMDGLERLNEGIKSFQRKQFIEFSFVALCKRYMLIYQIVDKIVYIDYVVDRRKEYEWLIV